MSLYDWMQDGLCTEVGTNVFFPGNSEQILTRQALAICHRCPVLDECREHAIRTNPEYGIIGGTTPKQRRKLRRKGTNVPTQRVTGIRGTSTPRKQKSIQQSHS